MEWKICLYIHIKYACCDLHTIIHKPCTLLLLCHPMYGIKISFIHWFHMIVFKTTIIEQTSICKMPIVVSWISSHEKISPIYVRLIAQTTQSKKFILLFLNVQNKFLSFNPSTTYQIGYIRIHIGTQLTREWYEGRAWNGTLGSYEGATSVSIFCIWHNVQCRVLLVQTVSRHLPKNPKFVIYKPANTNN